MKLYHGIVAWIEGIRSCDVHVEGWWVAATDDDHARGKTLRHFETKFPDRSGMQHVTVFPAAAPSGLFTDDVKDKE